MVFFKTNHLSSAILNFKLVVEASRMVYQEGVGGGKEEKIG